MEDVSLNLDGLSWHELLNLKRERKAELASLHGLSFELEAQLDQIAEAMRKIRRA